MQIHTHTSGTVGSQVQISFIQLSELGCRGLNENAQDLKQQQRKNFKQAQFFGEGLDSICPGYLVHDVLGLNGIRVSVGVIMLSVSVSRISKGIIQRTGNHSF